MQKDLNDGQKIVLSAIAGAFVLLVIESIFGDSKDNKNITKALITGAATGAIIGGLKVLAEKNDKKKQKDDLKESETEQKNSPQQETSKQNSTIRQNSAGYGLSNSPKETIEHIEVPEKILSKQDVEESEIIPILMLLPLTTNHGVSFLQIGYDADAGLFFSGTSSGIGFGFGIDSYKNVAIYGSIHAFANFLRKNLNLVDKFAELHPDMNIDRNGKNFWSVIFGASASYSVSYDYVWHYNALTEYIPGFANTSNVCIGPIVISINQIGGEKVIGLGLGASPSKGLLYADVEDYSFALVMTFQEFFYFMRDLISGGIPTINSFIENNISKNNYIITPKAEEKYQKGNK